MWEKDIDFSTWVNYDPIHRLSVLNDIYGHMSSIDEQEKKTPEYESWRSW